MMHEIIEPLTHKQFKTFDYVEEAKKEVTE
jgi:hypothetical protein